jgi:hypothetical protein
MGEVWRGRWSPSPCQPGAEPLRARCSKIFRRLRKLRSSDSRRPERLKLVPSVDVFSYPLYFLPPTEGLLKDDTGKIEPSKGVNPDGKPWPWPVLGFGRHMHNSARVCSFMALNPDDRPMLISNM